MDKKKGKPFSEKEALGITYQIVLGLSALSENNIVHRDMKPENIFINKRVFKLGDFGFAREVTDKFTTQLGTCLYMGPEFYNNDELTSKVDVWALGCMFHQMLFNELCYDGRNQMDVQNKVKNTPYKLPKGAKLDPKTENLIMGMLEKKPQDRLSIQDLRNHSVIFSFVKIKKGICIL